MVILEKRDTILQPVSILPFCGVMCMINTDKYKEHGQLLGFIQLILDFQLARSHKFQIKKDLVSHMGTAPAVAELPTRRKKK